MGETGTVLEAPHVAGTLSSVDEAATTATCLKISVLCEGRPVIQVSFPALAIFNLSDLVPDEVRPRVAAHALDLEQIASSFAARGCPPGELFTLPGPDHTVQAWME
jgi:hypothetical protein